MVALKTAALEDGDGIDEMSIEMTGLVKDIIFADEADEHDQLQEWMATAINALSDLEDLVAEDNELRPLPEVNALIDTIDHRIAVLRLWVEEEGR